MIRQRFMVDPDGGLPAFSNQGIFGPIWKKVEDFEKDTGKSLDRGFTMEEYMDLFSSMCLRRTSKFPVCKTVVMHYVRYLVLNGVLPPSQEKILSSITVDGIDIRKSKYVYYHKNIGDLEAHIKDCVSATTSFDPELYNLHACILYLAWFGFSKEEIVNLRKTDVLVSGIRKGAQIVLVPKRIMDNVFHRFRDATGYVQHAKGDITHTYQHSEYLIRTERKAQLNTQNLKNLLSSLNVKTGRANSLSYDVVHVSGVFYRAYQLECEGLDFDLSNVEFASRVFEEDLSDPRRYRVVLRDYQLYKQNFT